MPEKKTLRIFISYGHDEHAELAVRIKNDLEERGHEVWFDRDRIKPGKDFELYIEEGLKWLTEDKSRARFLYLMTPHSVRRPDGFCLNELTSAMMKELSIFPVMVQMSEPPLSICRIQWLDMQECFPSCENTPYSVKFERLLAALEDRNWDFEGFEKNLLKVFNPIDFGPDMLRHLKDFTGREWLKKEIEEWLEGKRPGNKQVFWIKGKPGIGKTAISSWLVSTMYEVVAVHFFRSDSTEKRDPVRFIHTLVYYLSTQIPEYKEQLEVLSQPVEHYLEEYKNDPNDLFYNLVILPLHRTGMEDRKALVVVIDGLDEASEESGGNEIARLIARQLEKAPSWLKFIVTSRSEAGINAELQGVTNPCELDSASEENEKDIREYLEMKLKPYLEEGMDEEKIILEILQKSEGLFVYVNAFMKALEEKALTLKDVGNFPGKLGEIYYTYFSSKFKGEDDYNENVSPVLEMILATVEPQDIELLTEVLGHKETQTLRVIRRLGSLFERNENRIIPFHSTLSEWLASEDRSFRYYVSEKEGHKRLAEYGLEKYEKLKDKKECKAEKDYAVRNLGIHLYESGMDEELEELLKGIAESSDEKGWKTGVLFNVCDHVIERCDFDKEDRLKRIIRELLPSAIGKSLADKMNELGEKHENRGKSLWCLFVYEKVLAVYESLLEKDPEDENLQSDLGVSLNNVGRICERLGKGEKALEYYMRSLEISESLVKRDPERTDWQSDLGVSLDNVGSIYERLGEGEKALEYYIRSLEISESLVKKEPSRTDWQRELGASLSYVGRIHEGLGEGGKALEYYNRLLEIMESLVKKDPGRTDWQSDLGVSLSYVGRIYEGLGEGGKALEYYMRSLETMESLVNKEPGRTDWQRELGVSLNNVGRIYQSLGEGNKALEHYMRSLETMENLVMKDPGRTDWQRDLGVGLNNVGKIYRSLGEGNKALEYYNRLLEIMESLVKKDPARTDWQRDLGVSLNNVGRIYQRLGEGEKALEYYHRALKIWRLLVEKEEEVVDRHVGLAFALLDISRVTANEEEKRGFVMEAYTITKSLVDAGVSHIDLNTLTHEVRESNVKNESERQDKGKRSLKKE